MESNVKLSGEERRSAIIRSVRRVFADKGFDGTTTRALADAAGVSEALLFKHFPNKEALFTAMHEFCCNADDPEKMDRIKALEPSTLTLVLIVHLMVTKTLGTEGDCDEDANIQSRLMVRSLLEDAEFARMFLERTMPCWVSKVEQCVQASAAAGELNSGPVSPYLASIFARQLPRMIMLSLVSDPPVIDYKIPRAMLVEQVVWFILRGIGVRDRAIRQYYNPEALNLFGS